VRHCHGGPFLVLSFPQEEFPAYRCPPYWPQHSFVMEIHLVHLLSMLVLITSIYHRLIYIDNSNINNSLQQNSKLLKVVLSNPNQLFCNAHALFYHHLFCLSTFHVGFSFQKTIQNNIYKRRIPCCTIFSNPLGLPLYNYWTSIAIWLRLATSIIARFITLFSKHKLTSR
jgi:hypothetical protein